MGFSDARVTDITQRAATSYGIFYRYFDDKEAVFREVAKAVTAELFEVTAVRDLGDLNAVQKIEAGNRRYLRAYARNARIMSVIEEAAPYHPYSRDLLRGIRAMFVKRNEAGLRSLQKQGRADSTIDAAIAARALGGMIEWYAHNVVAVEDDYDEDESVDVLTRIWAQGMKISL